jgi:hypothetical protein
MANQHVIDALADRAWSHRENAMHARGLALDLNDQRAKDGLAVYAADQDTRAAWLDAEITALSMNQRSSDMMIFWTLANQKT